MWSFSFFLCFIATCCYTCDERLYFVISDVSVNWPVWLHLLQELYLILDTGTGLKLLYHHLGGAETRIDLAQQNLKSIHRRRSKLEESRPQFIINSINTHLQSENVKLKQWERCMGGVTAAGIYCDYQLFSHGINTLAKVSKISLARMRSSSHYPRIPHRVESTLEYS